MDLLVYFDWPHAEPQRTEQIVLFSSFRGSVALRETAVS